MLSSMSAPKQTAVSEQDAGAEHDDPIVRSIDNAPLDPDALTAEEIVELEARLARPAGATFTTAEILERIAERAKQEG
jgi:hypothetical protein